MNSRFRLIATFTVLLSTNILHGCSSAQKDSDNPETLYKEAEADISSDRYILAHEKLTKLRSKYPYSKFAILALLKNADVYYKEESFYEAASAYQTFRELHPNHERVPYAMFMAGESFFKDIPSTVARDLSSANRAIQAFDDYLRKFPYDENAKAAKEHLAKSRAILAEKELYVGNFYFRRDRFVAAKGRYERLLELFPETEFANEAKQKLEKINEQIRNKE